MKLVVENQVVNSMKYVVENEFEDKRVLKNGSLTGH